MFIGTERIVLMRANPLQGSLELVGPENLDFLGHEMATSESSAIWAQKKLRKAIT
jgi:hypothetical protein